MSLKPSQVLELSLSRLRRDGWVPRGPGRFDGEKYRNGPCCLLTAMCRALRAKEPQGFAMPAASEAHEAMRDYLGCAIAEWNDTRRDVGEIVGAVNQVIRKLQARGR